LDYNSFVKQKFFSVILIAALLAGCKFQVDVIEAPTPITVIATVTLLPSVTPLPSLTRIPIFPTSTIVPVEAVASTQVNVRAEPNTASEVLGVLPPKSRVQVIGKDSGGNWWQIQYPSGADGKAWVATEFVALAEAREVPVVGASLNGGNDAVIQQQLNVRSGPGTSFNSIGTLNAQDVVTLTGKDANGAWLQINFAAGPDGKGWVNAAFVKATGVETLPIVGDAGQVIGTGAPVDTPLPPQPTVAPAPLDNDSASAPAINVTLTSSGTRSFQYSSDVSSPTGDAEDWIQFKTFSVNTKLELECTGSGSYIAVLLQNNTVVDNLVCGKIILFLTDPSAVYAVHFVSSPTGSLEYTRFTVRVEAIP